MAFASPKELWENYGIIDDLIVSFSKIPQIPYPGDPPSLSQLDFCVPIYTNYYPWICFTSSSKVHSKTILLPGL